MKTDLKTYIYSLAFQYKIYLISLVIIAITSAIFNIIVNYQIKEIIDSISSNPDQDILWILFSFGIYKFAYHGFYFINRLLDIKYKPVILKQIVEDAYSRTTNHSLYWFDSNLSGSIASRIGDWQDSIITILNLLFRILINLTVIFSGIIALFFINYLTSLVLICFILIYAPIIGLMLKKQNLLQSEYVRSRQEAMGIINDSIANIFSVKIIGKVVNELTFKLIPAINNWSSWDKKTRQYDAYYIDSSDTIIITIMSTAQIFLLAYLYKTGQITVGSFAFIITVTLAIYKEVETLLESILFDLNPKIATIKSSYNFINNLTDKDILVSLEATNISRVKGNIKWENVNFSYGSGADILTNFSLDVKSGQKIGIVGTSGAGKSTIVKSLLRYFDLKSGRILIDDHDISKITEESLREQLSLIPQDITMFHRSIIENIRIAKPDASIEEVKLACKKANIDETIENMQNGYDTIVGERGVKLSGGQRQRIAIARAILKNAPILILDEATSALDTPTEMLIQESINEMLLKSNFTVIAIAHRLSTLQNMDRIIVIDKGIIIQDGKHKELIHLEGLYKKLWNSQTST